MILKIPTIDSPYRKTPGTWVTAYVRPAAWQASRSSRLAQARLAFRNL